MASLKLGQQSHQQLKLRQPSFGGSGGAGGGGNGSPKCVHDVAGIERHGMSTALPSQPTAEMRRELRERGVALPTDDDLIELSEKLNAWITAYRYDQHLPISTSWYALFKVSQLGLQTCSSTRAYTCL